MCRSLAKSYSSTGFRAGHDGFSGFLPQMDYDAPTLSAFHSRRAKGLQRRIKSKTATAAAPHSTGYCAHEDEMSGLKGEHTLTLFDTG